MTFNEYRIAKLRIQVDAWIRVRDTILSSVIFDPTHKISEIKDFISKVSFSVEEKLEYLEKIRQDEIK